MDLLVEQVADPSPEARKQALAALLAACKSSHGILLVPHPVRFFCQVRECLTDPSTEVLLLAQELLQAVIPEFGPDLETSFSGILSSLVQLLQDTRPAVVRNALETLKLYITTTRNLESVMNSLVKTGLSSPKWRLRHQSLLCLLPLLKLDLSFTANTLEMKKIIENALVLTSDDSELVVACARDTVRQLKGLCYDFPSVFQKLHAAYQKSFMDQIEGCSQEPPVARRVPSQSPVQPPEDSVMFGFVPAALVQQLGQSTDWRERVGAMQELENLFAALSSLTVISPLFFKFLAQLLRDSNFKLVLSALNILEKTLLAPYIVQQANLTVIIPECIAKLGDNKITIRQRAFKVLKTLLLHSKPNVLMPQLVLALGSDNWHVREETVSVLIAGALSAREDFSYDFALLVPHFARLLDDSKTKIRFVATEALAVLASKCGASTVNAALKPIVAARAFSALQERFALNVLPIVQDECIEFPKSAPSSAPVVLSPHMTSESFASPLKTGIGPRKKFREPQPHATVYSPPKGTFSNKPVAELTEQPLYLSYSELEDLPSAEEALLNCLSKGQDTGWAAQFEALNTLRRLLKHHPELLASSVTLHAVVLDVGKSADSLRSSLSKNALIVIGELSEALGRHLDNEIPEILKILLKKAGDTNIFIAEEAKEALQRLCTRANEYKIVTALLNNSVKLRAPALKMTMALAFSWVFAKHNANPLRIRELDKAIEVLGKLIDDATGKVRTAAAAAFTALARALPAAELEQLLRRVLNEQTVRKVHESIEKRPELPRRGTHAPWKSCVLRQAEPEDLSELAVSLSKTDWKTRYGALCELGEYISQSQRLVAAFDLLNKGLLDSNVKVQVCALQVALRSVTVLGKGWDSYLGRLFESLVHSVGSSNIVVREAARDLCSALVAHTSAAAVLPAIVSAFNRANPRAKGALVTVVNEALAGVTGKWPFSVVKCVLPLALKLLEDSRREELRTLFCGLYSCMGNELFERIPPDKFNKVVDLLNGFI